VSSSWGLERCRSEHSSLDERKKLLLPIMDDRDLCLVWRKDGFKNGRSVKVELELTNASSTEAGVATTGVWKTINILVVFL